MHPAFSVIFLTTLIGAGQGLFVALYLVQWLSLPGTVPTALFVTGGVASVAFMAAGLGASFFHLGHPERAWRTAAMWRTSWLSREVIVLPAAMALVTAWTAIHALAPTVSVAGLDAARADGFSLAVGAVAVIVVTALYACTGMIYACVKFLAEWASPLTVVNFTMLGLASGFTLATLLAAWGPGSSSVGFLGAWALGLTLAGALSRVASLVRNERLKPRSNLQTAIGVRHSRIVQRAQGATAGSFNTREFFHGAAPAVYRAMRPAFLVFAFAVPAALLASGLVSGAASDSALLPAMAFASQFAGLLAERWYFFAQANHPQNLYYQYVS